MCQPPSRQNPLPCTPPSQGSSQHLSSCQHFFRPAGLPHRVFKTTPECHQRASIAPVPQICVSMEITSQNVCVEYALLPVSSLLCLAPIEVPHVPEQAPEALQQALGDAVCTVHMLQPQPFRFCGIMITYTPLRGANKLSFLLVHYLAPVPLFLNPAVNCIVSSERFVGFK